MNRGAGALFTCSGTGLLGRVQRESISAYALRHESPWGWLERLASRLIAPFQAVSGSWVVLSRIVREVQRHAARFEGMDDDDLKRHSTELRYRLKASGMARQVVVETFALVREVADRHLGMRHFDVQLAGGWAMLNGMIAEMETPARVRR